MTTSPRRADGAPERPFRGPVGLALALPLTAALGLTVVMAAASLGQSTLIVTLAAAGGFVLCALAPLALLQVHVGRPLRHALAHLRAARDGAEPPAGPPPLGVIADLVAVARDIQGAQQHIGHYRAGVALCETLAAAGDEAIRAFRLQCEELAETSAQGETQWRLSAQGQFAEIAEALKVSKTTAPSTALESGLERIEQMLVYLAEMSERRETSSEGEDRGEGALTDIVRLIGREAQAIRDTVATAALTLRNDITSVGADDKAAHGRQQERLETLARVLDGIGAEAQTTRRALQETLVRLDAAEAVAPPEGEMMREDARAAADLGEAIADLGVRLREQGQAQTGRLDEIEARLSHEFAEARRDGHATALAVLARCTDKLRNALDRFDVLSAAAASAATGQSDDLSAALRALEGEVAAFGDRLAQGVASGVEALEGVASRSEAQAVRLGAFANETLTAFVEAHGQTFDALRAEMAGVAPRVEGLCEGIVRRLDTFDAKSLQPATRDLAAAQARAESFARQLALSAAALAELAEREGRDFDGLRLAVETSGAPKAGHAPAARQEISQRLGRPGSAPARASETVATPERLGESGGPLAPALTSPHDPMQALEAGPGSPATQGPPARAQRLAPQHVAQEQAAFARGEVEEAATGEAAGFAAVRSGKAGTREFGDDDEWAALRAAFALDAPSSTAADLKAAAYAERAQEPALRDDAVDGLAPAGEGLAPAGEGLAAPLPPSPDRAEADVRNEEPAPADALGAPFDPLARVPPNGLAPLSETASQPPPQGVRALVATLHAQWDAADAAPDEGANLWAPDHLALEAEGRRTA